MTVLITALGLALALEGLILALAPARFEELLQFFASLSRDRRRVLGLATLAIGVLLIWLSHLLR